MATRNHRQTYADRNARAVEAGFRSYSQQRRYRREARQALSDNKVSISTVDDVARQQLLIDQYGTTGMSRNEILEWAEEVINTDDEDALWEFVREMYSRANE